MRTFVQRDLNKILQVRPYACPALHSRKKLFFSQATFEVMAFRVNARYYASLTYRSRAVMIDGPFYQTQITVRKYLGQFQNFYCYTAPS